MATHTEFHFSRVCDDDPAVVLLLVEEMFQGLAALGAGEWVVREPPTLDRAMDFASGKRLVCLHCRVSATGVEAPAAVGFWSWSEPDGVVAVDDSDDGS